MEGLPKRIPTLPPLVCAKRIMQGMRKSMRPCIDPHSDELASKTSKTRVGHGTINGQ